MQRKYMRILVGIFVISASFFFLSNNEADPDIWGHLKFGQDIYEKQEVPRYDTYSYSSYGARWINHEWLSELIFFTIFKFGKGAGLLVFKFIIGLIIASIIFVSISGKTKITILKLIFFLIPLSVIEYGFLTRPQIFTYLFFTAFVFFIDRFEETSKPHWLYPLPFISLAWCNLHGGFVIGIGILFLFSLIKIFQRRAAKELIIMTALTAAVTLINPNGRELLIFLFKSLSKPRSYIIEWQRIELSRLYLDYFVLLFLAVIGIFFSKIKRSAYEIAALFIAFLYSFQHNRHIVLFAILTAIYIPKYIDSFAKRWLMGFEEKVSQKFLLLTFVFLSLYFFLMAPYGEKTDPFKIKIHEDMYPMDAISFMNDNKITGNIFSFFNWAQMCIRELPDTCRVFFDGRYRTVYSNELIRDYFDVLYGNRDHKEYLARFPETDIMLLDRTNPLTLRLINDEEWIPIYTTHTAWIFLKDNKKNQDIIQNFKRNKLIYNRKRPAFYLHQ